MKKGILCAVFLLAVTATAAAQPFTFVVRHAERADSGQAPAMMATDPDLSAAGRARAESLAAMLKDASITAIFVTQYKRTQQTAAPLAKALGITPTVVPSRDTAGLAARIAAHDGNVLVVGHSNSVPAVVQALGRGKPFEIPETEFDNLFIVTRGSSPSVARLRFR